MAYSTADGGVTFSVSLSKRLTAPANAAWSVGDRVFFAFFTANPLVGGSAVIASTPAMLVIA